MNYAQTCAPGGRRPLPPPGRVDFSVGAREQLAAALRLVQAARAGERDMVLRAHTATPMLARFQMAAPKKADAGRPKRRTGNAHWRGQPLAQGECERVMREAGARGLTLYELRIKTQYSRNTICCAAEAATAAREWVAVGKRRTNGVSRPATIYAHFSHAQAHAQGHG